MSPRAFLFFGNFFLSISSALLVYILLPFLSSYIPESVTGLVIAGGGALSLSLFFVLPHWGQTYGAQRLALTFGTVEMIALLVLSAAPGVLIGTLLIVMVLALQPCISYTLDLLLQSASLEHDSIGRIRTSFLTAWDIGALVAPLLLAAVLVNSNAYSRVFIASSMMLVPFIILFARHALPRAIVLRPAPLRDTLRCIVRDRDLSAVILAHFLLYLFYIWAPFYVPVYLHNNLGIPWSSLGWVFSIMLLPYVLLEYPTGWIADRLLGDKEMMLAGFLIAGTSLASMGLLTHGSSLALILFILVCSRVGTTLIEAMTEGHFFRRVTEQDVNSMSFFRSVWPLASTIAPIVASLVLFYGNFPLFFFITGGFIVAAGTFATLRIKDFR
ncbi:MFS transporter [Patescibacteria group bacterium]|nr:MFS transporter [Patescibacteria group bacterium]